MNSNILYQMSQIFRRRLQRLEHQLSPYLRLTAGRFANAETPTSRAGHRFAALAFMASQFSKLSFQLVDVLHRQQFEVFINAVRFFAWTPRATVGLDLLEDVIANLERNPTPAVYSGAARRFSFALTLGALTLSGVGPALIFSLGHCYHHAKL
ncbi:TPA: hypothetical protein SMF39_003709 [Serratia marcescens]|nr:hypothetical protein [Serratia marcescens]